MTLRRTLATTVAAAVTAPVVLLCASSAWADVQPPARTQHQPTYAELQKAAADADRAYTSAVAAKEAAFEKLRSLESNSHPLRAAFLAAQKAAKAAEADKSAADKAVAEAKAKVEAAKDETEKAAALKVLEAAEATAKKADAAKTEAGAKSKAAGDELAEAELAASQEYAKVRDVPEAALKAKKAADEAVEAAKVCVRVAGLTVLANGLPSKAVAGTTVDFSFTVANGTERTLDVRPLAFFALRAKGQEQPLMKVEWADGSTWKRLDPSGSVHTSAITGMQPGARTEVKMRMTLDEKVSANKAIALFAGDAADRYNPCVLGPMKRYDVTVLPAGSKPGDVEDAKPGEADDKDRPSPKPGPSAQGGKSVKPTADAGAGAGASATPGTSGTGGSGGSGGSLATTGSSSAMPQLALAGGAAVLVGAGAVLAVRRRSGKSTG